ncbi:hypothetical protein ACF1AJ_00050 [Leifsonia sp. NPDC014704]|uniref:hypothetical protein n=1 Tax=Leifsonia sp. NPDC014704 TaxID=3364123 RepID=UPI0036F48644
MTSSTRIRFGALTAAAAVVAGGFFAAAPAHAATGTLTLANTTFTAGDWGTGLNVAGSGFSADAVVTITVETADHTAIDQHDLTADATGSFQETYTPAVVLTLPAAGESYAVTATSNLGDTSNTVPLTVNAAALPKAIISNVSTITTDQLADKNSGVSILASGYTPGEQVNVTVDYAGEALDLGPYTVEADGSVGFSFYLVSGVATAGPLTVTVAGQQSGVSQSVTIQVTGVDVSAGGSAVPSLGGAAAAAASGPSRLPVVSG